MKKEILKISVFVLLISCSVGPSYVPPPIEIPLEWKNKNESECPSMPFEEFEYLNHWWEIFEDQQLDALEHAAIENNRSLQAAFERVKELRAQMGIAEADFYPQLTLNPLYSSTDELLKNYTTTTGLIIDTALSIPTIFRADELLYFLPINLSYEVDLWGKIRDQYLVAKYNWKAQQNDYDSMMLTLTTSLATAYYQLRAADAQLDLLLKILKTRQKSYQINLDRYEGQIAFYSDVALAGEEVESALIQYNEVTRQRNVLENQIALLIGVPASEFALASMPLEGLPPCIPEGIPSEILSRRPDLAESKHLTQSAHEMVKQAYSQFFPSLVLTGAGGSESPVFRDFLKWFSRYLMGGVQINQLVFDGGKTNSNLKLQIARFQESSLNYQELVLTAFQEVENALVDLNSYAKEYDHTSAAVSWAQKANQLYSDRYKGGLIYYIDVVNTERDLLNFQINENALLGYRYLSTIQLIKALGGGWDYNHRDDRALSP